MSRVLIASVFVGLGAERLIGAAGGLSDRRPLGAAGLAFSIFELLAGLSIVIGWQAGRLALVMAVFLIVDAFAAHAFWNFAGAEQHEQYLHFLKNLSATGGLLLLSCTEAQPPVLAPRT